MDIKYGGSDSLQVQVTTATHHQHYTEAELKCHSSCSPAGRLSFVWFKNGQRIMTEGTSSYKHYFYPGDSYVCAVEGHEDSHSPPVCVGGQSCNRVTYTQRSICAPKGSSVDISSTYSSSGSITSKLWFSPERSRQWVYQSQPEDLSEDPQYAGRVQVLETEGGRSTLRITELTERDSAQYHFKFTAGSFDWRSSLPGTTLTVTALQVQVTTTTHHQLYTEAELKCHSSCSPAGRLSYVWFKNGQRIMREETSYKDNFYPGDKISCAFKGREDYRSPSVYAPKPFSVSVNSSEIMEGSSVNLTCRSDANPAANYTWYKDGDPDLKPLSEDPHLVLTSVQSSNSGKYYCIAENALGRRTSESISVDVRYPPKLPSVSASGDIVEGSSVNLTCCSDANPAATYTWHKENRTLPVGSAGNHHFTSIRSEDSGIYYCKAENQYAPINSTSVHIDVQYAPRLPSVSVSPSAEIVEGSSVNLTCSSDANPAANYTWYKEDEDSPTASGQIFTITDFRAEHSGNYYCEARNSRGRHNNTLHLALADKRLMKLTAVGIIAVVLLAVVALFLLLWIRKKPEEPEEPEERPDRREQEKPEEQDELQYASIHFSSDPLYSNIRSVQLLRHAEQQEVVEYAAVKFKAPPRGERSSYGFNSSSSKRSCCLPSLYASGTESV
ncbi:cell adhesion molecule CEACAM1-like [Pempheris klunzingeri]|uniref:cell adhesion molecule CEACAM1-like n=1 Tax=Pempheris klunzingeri TaxID=3127111 RepID=UPI003980B9F4